MATQPSLMHTPKAISRITALWAVTECGLGGFFHAIRSPFTGLIVGGLAVVYISLIAWHSQHKTRDLSRALLFVLVVKFAVSPHSPLGAYMAVSMQAGFGIIFFGLLRSYRVAAVLTATFSMASSALQKIIILTLLFGTSLWRAIDEFAAQTVAKMDFLQLPPDWHISTWLVLLYAGIYIIGGLIIGFITASLPQRLQSHREELAAVTGRFHFVAAASTQKRKRKHLLMVILPFIILTSFVFVLEYFYISAETAWHQLLRTLIVIFAWIMLLKPLSWFLLKKYLKDKQNTYRDQILNIRTILPELSNFSRFAWRESKSMNGSIRILNFIELLIYYSMYEL